MLKISTVTDPVRCTGGALSYDFYWAVGWLVGWSL